jgi:plastocyanin
LIIHKSIPLFFFNLFHTDTSKHLYSQQEAEMRFPNRFLRPLSGSLIAKTWVAALGVIIHNGVEGTSESTTDADLGIMLAISTASSMIQSETSSTTTTVSTSDSYTTTSTSTSTTATGITTHTIQVGPKVSPHAYVPQNITANPGDILVFEFYPTNHSVAKADYLAPCVPASSGEFWSGEFNTFTESNGELVGPVSQGCGIFYCLMVD